MENEKLNNEIDLKHIIDLVLSKWLIISVVTFVFGVFAFVYSSYFVTTLYSAETKVYVNSSKSFNLNSEEVTSAELTSSEKLVPTYMEIVKSKKVASQAVKETKLNYSVDSVLSMIDTAPVEGTGVFYISIKSADPRHAAHLANTIAEVAMVEIENYIEGSSAKIIDFAEIATDPTSPNIKLNTLVGFLLGLICSIGVIFTVDFFDVRIKTEEDLLKVTKYPILGNIPRLESDTSGSYGYTYKSRYAKAYTTHSKKDGEDKKDGGK